MKKAKRCLSLLLATLMVLAFFQGCTEKIKENSTTGKSTPDELSQPTTASYHDETPNSFVNLNDTRLIKYMEDSVYSETLKHIDNEKYAVENVSAVYISKEFLEDSAYNSKSNIYFGYTLDELDKQFQGTKYVFTLGEDGKTTVREFEPYDDTYDKIFLNIAIGTGVILVCVVLTVVTEGAGAPAAAAIFAVSAKSGAIAAISSGVLGATAAGVFTGIETHDFDKSLKAAALSGSEGYKWGAITGAISGGASEAVALRGTAKGGLTMNQVAQIQKESKYPLDVIKQLGNMEQYQVLKDAGLSTQMINGKTALIRNIDLNYIDEATGMTNLTRMQKGLAPLDPTGVPYELHHIGQKTNSTIAILTRAEHRAKGNYNIWHEIGGATDNPSTGTNWITQRTEFWKTMTKVLGGSA